VRGHTNAHTVEGGLHEAATSKLIFEFTLARSLIVVHIVTEDSRSKEISISISSVIMEINDLNVKSVARNLLKRVISRNIFKFTMAINRSDVRIVTRNSLQAVISVITPATCIRMRGRFSVHTVIKNLLVDAILIST
jgi:hypothetical protein